MVILLISILSHSTRRLVGIIKVLCFSLIPLAAIASLLVHILIQYDKIPVIDDSSKAIDSENMVQNIKTIHRKDAFISHGSF